MNIETLLELSMKYGKILVMKNNLMSKCRFFSPTSIHWEHIVLACPFVPCPSGSVVRVSD